MPMWRLRLSRERNVFAGRCLQLRLRAKIVVYTLFYNVHLNNPGYACDIMLEPLIRFTDNYVRYLGPLFVAFLMGMMALVIALCYLLIVPYEWVRTPILQIVIYFAVGHWLLINTLFHYTMGWLTSPGTLPKGTCIPEAISICKHCISPKPPRAHHCSLCNRCILKMDHHCPWLNQCVGHFNHRYFYLCMAFMWLGCIYIVWGSSSCFWEHYFSHPERMTYDSLQYGVGVHNLILFVFITSMAMVVGLGGLLAWHTHLISTGQTSIEQHINRNSQRIFQRRGQVFVNPYDYGIWNNWRIFLGIDRNGKISFWKHILFPSTHKPLCSGLTWHSSTFTGVDYDNFDGVEISNSPHLQEDIADSVQQRCVPPLVETI